MGSKVLGRRCATALFQPDGLSNDWRPRAVAAAPVQDYRPMFIRRRSSNITGSRMFALRNGGSSENRRPRHLVTGWN
jgi:hypothetical protein